MIIKTKFDVGQEVYYLTGKFASNVQSGEILQIKFYGKEIIYEIEYNGNVQEEQYVFATKEEAELKLSELKGE